ncbi:MAG: DUF6116 family protein [Xanthomonadales bacterium]|nr:DUF6116 family protein [Xanthomonadales bacterium]
MTTQLHDLQIPMFGSQLQRFVARLRFPQLFLLTAALALVNFFVPDPVPLVDELLLVVGAALLGSLKDRKRTRRDD